MTNKPILSETITVSNKTVKCSPEYKKLFDEVRSYDGVYATYDEMPDDVVTKIIELETAMMYLDLSGHLD